MDRRSRSRQRPSPSQAVDNVSTEEAKGAGSKYDSHVTIGVQSTAHHTTCLNSLFPMKASEQRGKGNTDAGKSLAPKHLGHMPERRDAHDDTRSRPSIRRATLPSETSSKLAPAPISDSLDATSTKAQKCNTLEAAEQEPGSISSAGARSVRASTLDSALATKRQTTVLFAQPPNERRESGSSSRRQSHSIYSPQNRQAIREAREQHNGRIPHRGWSDAQHRDDEMRDLFSPIHRSPGCREPALDEGDNRVYQMSRIPVLCSNRHSTVTDGERFEQSAGSRPLKKILEEQNKLLVSAPARTSAYNVPTGVNERDDSADPQRIRWNPFQLVVRGLV